MLRGISRAESLRIVTFLSRELHKRDRLPPAVIAIAHRESELLIFFYFTSPDPLDCSASTCGSESWLVVNSDKYESFFSTANGAPTCGDAAKTYILTLNPVICQCPFDDVFPCTCSITQGEVASPSVTVSINCSGLMLGDKGVETLLNKVPATNAMVGIVLSGNDLTYVPKKLSQFDNLVLVVLSKNNISAVKQGDLALASPQANSIDLSNNQIKTIENGSFPSELRTFKNYNLIQLLTIHNY